MKYILTIDDDEALCKLVKKCIETEQVPVYTFLRGEDALSFFYQNQSDCVLVILDIMLPGMDGYSVLEKVRAVSNVPVLMLTAKDQEEDKVAGLQNGADDYLTKPFGLAELTARVNSLVRRYTKFNPHHEENQRLRFHDMIIDPSAHSVEVQGKPVSLTAREFDILLFLAQHKGRIPWINPDNASNYNNDPLCAIFDLGAQKSITGVSTASLVTQQIKQSANLQIYVSNDKLDWFEVSKKNGYDQQEPVNGVVELSWDAATDKVKDHADATAVYARYVKVVFSSVSPDAPSQQVALDEIEILGSSDRMEGAYLHISQGNCKTVMLTWKSVAPDICDMLFSMPPNMFAFGVLHSRPILKRSVLRESITMLPSLMLLKSW